MPDWLFDQSFSIIVSCSWLSPMEPVSGFMSCDGKFFPLRMLVALMRRELPIFLVFLSEL